MAVTLSAVNSGSRNSFRQHIRPCEQRKWRGVGRARWRQLPFKVRGSSARRRGGPRTLYAWNNRHGWATCVVFISASAFEHQTAAAGEERLGDVLSVHGNLSGEISFGFDLSGFSPEPQPCITKAMIDTNFRRILERFAVHAAQGEKRRGCGGIRKAVPR